MKERIKEIYSPPVIKVVEFVVEMGLGVSSTRFNWSYGMTTPQAATLPYSNETTGRATATVPPRSKWNDGKRIKLKGKK